MSKVYDILILGGGIAGLSAAEAARATDPDCSICILSAEKHPPYSRPMLTKLPMAQYKVDNTFLHPPGWYADRRIALALGTAVQSLDVRTRTVVTDAGVFHYGKCVYALGADNFIPPFPGRERAGVIDIRRPADIDKLKRQSLLTRDAVVIGGGVIGLEAAYILAGRGLCVSVLETAPYLMPRLLDEESARCLQSRITRFAVHTGVQVLGIIGSETAQAVEVQGMPPIPAGLVVVSCGVRANTAVAQSAGIAVERALVVDDRMRTDAADVYACGDCAQYRGVNTGLWSQAVAQGAVAGTNAAGGDTRYAGADAALIFHCEEFSVYSAGDMGKDPTKKYTVRTSEIQSADSFAVNARPGGGYRRDYYVDGALIGSFLLGDLSGMQSVHRQIFGEAP